MMPSLQRLSTDHYVAGIGAALDAHARLCWQSRDSAISLTVLLGFCRAIFLDILDFCARVLAIQHGGGFRWTSGVVPVTRSPNVIVGGAPSRSSGVRLEPLERTNR